MVPVARPARTTSIPPARIIQLEAATGSMAFASSFILVSVGDVVVFRDLSGSEDIVKFGEDTKFLQWARIIGTGLVIPDILIGGPRELAEFAKIGAEAQEGAVKSAEAFAKSQRNRELAQNMRRPSLHARAVQRHQYRAKRLAAEAKAAARSVKSAHYQMVTTLMRDANTSFVASPGSLGLLGALPPDMLSPKSPGLPHNLLSPDNPAATNARIEIRISTNRRVVP